ncbi:cell division protein FtsL [Pallidibacillus thermolactis]|uniref:cell division protein FtsL n=1 Tax=Pallidibacillus thermolactis TaxID=251051 RepID=UPI0021D91677|nr:cell division protein FtsL [Pallidibacillus thermolactis]MCU9600053.1 cell division protein FtsL [Pallidibacillus thermolactis subsp. kokeshiiformis]
MSNLAKKYHIQEVVQPEQKPKKRIVKKKRRITKGEKYIYILFGIVCFCLSYFIISNQTSIYKVNREIQVIDAKIVEQSKEMEELQGQVDELLEYGRVLKVAKEQGLELQKNNVKAVPKP